MTADTQDFTPAELADATLHLEDIREIGRIADQLSETNAKLQRAFAVAMRGTGSAHEHPLGAVFVLLYDENMVTMCEKIRQLSVYADAMRDSFKCTADVARYNRMDNDQRAQFHFANRDRLLGRDPYDDEAAYVDNDYKDGVNEHAADCDCGGGGDDDDVPDLEPILPEQHSPRSSNTLAEARRGELDVD